MDPFIKAGALCPGPRSLSLFTEPGPGPCWLYAPGELEAWFFNRMRHESFHSCLNVGHPGYFRAGRSVLFAMREWHLERLPEEARIRIAACGNLHVTLNGRTLLHTPASPKPDPAEVDIRPDLLQGDNCFNIRLHSLHAPPSLLIEGWMPTDGRWAVSTDACRYTPPHKVAFVGTARFPHEERLPETDLEPVSVRNGVWDFGVEVYRRPEAEVRGTGTLTFHPGESEAEALNTDPAHHEQHVHGLKPSHGRVSSPDELALRYLRIESTSGLAVERVHLRASTYPVEYQGAFSSDDPMLDRIWRHAAYTLRLCMREFFVDGIKRDRLPWVGDLYLAGLSNACVFFDAGIMRRTLVTLYGADPERIDFNGIIDYSFFGILALHDYVMHFGDISFLDQMRPQLERLLQALEKKRDGTGMIPVNTCQWLFIDWADVDKKGYSACLEFLSVWVLTAAAQLFSLLEDSEAAAHWVDLAKQRREAARRLFWSEEAGAFRDCSGSPRVGRHANFLAVLADVATAEQRPRLVQNVLLNSSVPPVGTPYMRSLEASALARCGRRSAMMEAVRQYWGGMLQAGATSFWEHYNPAAATEKDHLSMYGRRYGASLCHAWSAGPVFLLSRELFGLKPLAPGWSRFTLRPGQSQLPPAAVTVPTPNGPISVKKTGCEIQLQVPPESVLEYNSESFKGPGKMTFELPEK